MKIPLNVASGYHHHWILLATKKTRMAKTKYFRWKYSLGQWFSTFLLSRHNFRIFKYITVAFSEFRGTPKCRGTLVENHWSKVIIIHHHYHWKKSFFLILIIFIYICFYLWNEIFRHFFNLSIFKNLLKQKKTICTLCTQKKRSIKKWIIY